MYAIRSYYGTLPAPTGDEAADGEFQGRFPKALAEVDRLMDELAFNKALQVIWELVRAGNKYIDDTAPWALAKNEADNIITSYSIHYTKLYDTRMAGVRVRPSTSSSCLSITFPFPASTSSRIRSTSSQAVTAWSTMYRLKRSRAA